MTDLPSDLHITAADEVKIRQDLLLVALGKRPADRILRVGRLFDVHSRHWFEDQEIVIKGRRIAWVGPAGAYTGTAAEHVHEPSLSAVPGFGEVHKHIESSHLTPEYEAALVLPRGNSWTCEASHEFSNVDGPHNLELWFKARAAGSPLKIFPQPGSAVPPTAYEWGGGYFGHAEQQDFMARSLMVTGLDEVMDWPAVWNPENPSHGRLWGMIEATFAARGVVEGHAAGLRALPEINAFAAAGMASDHEMFTAEEAWDKLRRGLFIEIRIHTMTEIIKGLLDKGLEDWSQVAFATDDRSSTLTLDIGATDHNVRTAIAAGLSPEIAIQCVTINPARHMRLTPWVGAIAPGRYADIVLLEDVPSLTIAKVWADGRQVSEGTRYLPEVPQIDWPEWARTTVNIRREIIAENFAIKAAPGRSTMQAAVIRPFHWHPEFYTVEMPVENGEVQRLPSETITKFAIVDRFSGEGKVSKMFWRGCGPRDADTALACSVAHDKHNIWVCGSSDAAMAKAVNALRAQQGGWALVHAGELVATVRFEIGGLMSQRPAEAVAADMAVLRNKAEKIDWMYEPTWHPRWHPGFPERLMFATLTCAPWTWVLVAPSPLAPEGFVNVATGETHPVVW
ncbi:adenine deaminase [Devosia sp.]|uniref:adenine deaminase n=1 Tax=Devosia sp. TaxID=1871048 RepID=UPI003BA8AADD